MSEPQSTEGRTPRTDGGTSTSDMYRFPSPNPEDYEPPEDYGMVAIDGERLPESVTRDWPRFMVERSVVVGTRSVDTGTDQEAKQ